MTTINEEARKMFEAEPSEDLMGILKEFVQLKSEYKMRSELLDDLKGRINALEESLVSEMKSKNLRNMKLESGEMVSVANQIEYRVSAEDRLKQVDWAMKEGLEGLLSVNARTWSSFCRKAVEEGKTIPEFVKLYEYQTIQTRGVK